MAEDFRTWVPKVEAAKTLGIGIRTLERRIPNRKPLAVLPPEDFAALQAEMMQATPAPVENESKEIAVRSVSRSALEVVALMRAAQASPTLPLFLDLKAAVTYSGLPEAYLRELIAQNKLKAVKRGSYYVSRFALEELAR